MVTIKRIKNDNENLKSLTFEVESLLFERIKGSYPGNWQEDNITHTLLHDLKKIFSKRRIYTPGNSIETSWSLFSLANDIETAISDFAVVVKINYHDGQQAEGIAFFDAKGKDPDKNTFSSLKANQLKRINSVSPHSQILLYDYDSITGMAFPSTAESVIGNYPHSWNHWLPSTNGASVPINLATTLGIKSTGLYKISVPFSYQLCYRYLYGLDLDFQKSALEIGKGLKTDKGNPHYLVFLSIAHGGADLHDDFEYSDERYIEIE